MPYAFTLTSKIPASAQEIYGAWLDSLAHSEMTGSEASMSDEIGAEVSAWEGYISGRNLELVPGERIVQSWRTTKFADEHEDSIVTVLLEETEDGTLLTLVHSNVPDDQRNYEEGGWESNYFEPMKAYFGDRSREAAVGAPKRSAKSAAPKPKRAAGKASKRAAPRSKPASGRRKTKKRVVAAKAKGKHGKTAKSKGGKPKSAKKTQSAKSKSAKSKSAKKKPGRRKRS